MITLRQHMPGYVEGIDPKMAEAETIEELLAIPWVAAYAEPMGGPWDTVAISWPDGPDRPPEENPVHFDAPVRPFFRWSIAEKGTPHQMLMVEHDGGDHFWVVGRLTSPDPIPLPAWQITPAGQARVDRWNRGEG
jgi:hypothetical protein